MTSLPRAKNIFSVISCNMEADNGTKALKKALVDYKCQVNIPNLMNQAETAVKM